MRPARLLATLGVLATWPLSVRAQASSYLPISHWATPYIEHLIARGLVVDPTPLTRPWRRSVIVSALKAADTTALTAPERRVVARIVAALDDPEAGPHGRVDADLGTTVASTALRDPLELDRGVPDHQPEPARGFVSGGLRLEATFGPVVLVTHPMFDTRLKYDPDFKGKKDRFIAGRDGEAYLSAQWRYGELFFGTVDRNWGPPALQGLLISPAPYSYDHLGITIGTAGLHLDGILTQLDDLADTSGTQNHRFLVARRLVYHRPGSLTVSLWEGDILAGPGRQLEPWYANIVSLGLLQQYDQSTKTNSLLGADVQARIAGTNAFGSLLIDDIQIDHGGGALSGNNEPASYGFTLGATRPAAGGAWTLFYTRVADLTYRTPNPAETVERQGVGLARYFSDYDQVTVRGSYLGPFGALLAPELTLVRQGQGDFHLTYPTVAQYGSTATFLSGTPERIVRLALGGSLDRDRWGVSGNAGVHFVHDLGHLVGSDATRFVGTLTVQYRLGGRSALP